MALLRFLVATLLIGSVSGGAEPVAAGDDACVLGDCTNGHGTAKYVWGEYTGEWRDSLRQGYGVLTSTDGSKYDGEWKAGTKHGRGAITFATGTKVLSYDGEWKDGVTHGHGVMLFANGAKYDGEWTDGTKHGHGVYSWPSGDRYVGEFKAGAFHGHGVKTFADGDMVEGLFRDGEFIEVRRGPPTRRRRASTIGGVVAGDARVLSLPQASAPPSPAPFQRHTQTRRTGARAHAGAP